MAQSFITNQFRKSVSPLLRPSNFYFRIKNQQRAMAENLPDKDIKYDDLKDKVLNGTITFIDVREPNELKDDGKIPNSVNIPVGQVVDAFQLPDSSFQSKYGIPKPTESDSIVVSCRSGKRATNALNKLVPLGYQNALVYTGSFQDWVKNGGPIEK